MTTQHLEGEPSLSEIVAENVRAEMARKRMSQGAMALAMGMSRVTVNDRCTGKTPWTLDEMQRAAHVFRVPLSVLLLPRLDSNQQPFVYVSSEVSEGVVIDLAAYRAERDAPVEFGPLAMFGPLNDLERRRAARA